LWVQEEALITGVSKPMYMRRTVLGTMGNITEVRSQRKSKNESGRGHF